MSPNTPSRRIRVWAAAAALTITVAGTGCTALAWDYNIPPAAGAQADAPPVKARNILVVAGEDGNGALVGSVASREAVSLVELVVQPETTEGDRGDAVSVAIEDDFVPRRGVLSLEGLPVTGADLVQGRLAYVMMRFSDGTQLVVDAPVFSDEHPDFSTVLQD